MNTATLPRGVDRWARLVHEADADCLAAAGLNSWGDVEAAARAASVSTRVFLAHLLRVLTDSEFRLPGKALLPLAGRPMLAFLLERLRYADGAVCLWDLNIDTNTMNGWTLDSNPGLNQVAIFGVFQKNQNNANFDIVKDTFSTTARDYKADEGDGGVYACGSYNAEGYTLESRILPYSFDPNRSDRKLWIKILTPLVVTDQLTRNIQIVVTAKMID